MKNYTMKYFCPIIIFFMSLSILSCSNQPDGDRIMADFVTNVYSKIDSTKGYSFGGYYSTADVKIARFGARVFRERDTLNIIMNYYCVDEFKEWGFDGWIISKH